MTVANVYLALGDSITAGYGVGCNYSFATIYYASLCTCLPGLRYCNVGTNGLTTGGLAGTLANSLQFRNLIRKAGIISLTIGSNDMLGSGVTAICGGQVDFPTIATRMVNNLELIGRQIRFLNPSVVILAGTIYNPLPAGPFQQYAAEVQVMIDQANLILLNWARKFCVGLVLLDRVFRGKETVVLGADHVHPGLYGHQVIAAEFRKSWLPTKTLFCPKNNPFSFFQSAV